LAPLAEVTKIPKLGIAKPEFAAMAGKNTLSVIVFPLIETTASEAGSEFGPEEIGAPLGPRIE